MDRESIAIVLTVAILSSVFVRVGVHSDWYSVVRPPSAPPPLIFALTWCILYTSLAYSLSHTRVPILHYIHLLSGSLWCLQFFVFHHACSSIGTSLVVMWTAMVLVVEHEPWRWYLIPLVMWCSLAVYLNAEACSLSINHIRNCDTPSANRRA